MTPSLELYRAAERLQLSAWAFRRVALEVDMPAAGTRLDRRGAGEVDAQLQL
jgi:hypothetical protein